MHQLGTTHIRSMLAQAVDACEAAEELWREREDVLRDGGSVDEYDEDIQRLLTGAAINAQHAWGEINDERFRLRYGSRGYEPRRKKNGTAG